MKLPVVLAVDGRVFIKLGSSWDITDEHIMFLVEFCPKTGETGPRCMINANKIKETALKAEFTCTNHKDILDILERHK